MSKIVWEKLGMLIMDNHTLYGLHMEGNEWYIDKFGFINVDNKTKIVDNSKHTIAYPQNLNGFSTTIKFSKPMNPEWRPYVNCWVCEGWSEETFEVSLDDFSTSIEDPIHIHFEYNNFKPELMRWSKGDVYSYTTMWPPGKVKYFFSADKTAVYANSHPKSIRKVPRVIPDIEMYDEVKTYRISRFNYRIVEQKQVLNDWYMTLLKEWMPRMRQLKYRSKIRYRVKEQWVVTNSVFADYLSDTQNVIDKLFESDWKKVQKPKVSEEELAKIKTELK